MGYRLGIDVGTTYTAAAVVVDGHAQMVGLGNRALQVPTVLFFKPDGEVLVGEAAEARGALEPGRLVREFKRRIGDPVPILVAGSPQSPQSLLAKMLSWVVASASTSQGAPPDQVTVTHPANWGPYKLDLFRQALRLAELDGADTLTEPAAAAISYASRNRMSDGDVVVVYDLGGGTFDVAALRRSENAFEPLGQPEGIEHLGGIDFDEAVFRHVLAALPSAASALDPQDPDVRLAIARLRRDCVLGKEALSADTETLIPVSMPGVTTSVRLTRAEFEEMVAPTLADTLNAVRRAMASADLSSEDVSAFVLVGGSSRIPLVSERLTAEFGRPVAIDTHPKHEIALGAAIASLPQAQPAAAATTSEPEASVVAAAGPAGAATEDAPTEELEPTPAAQQVDPGLTTAPTKNPATGPPAALRRRGVLIGGVVGAVAVVSVTAAVVLGGGGGDATGANGTIPSVAVSTPSGTASPTSTANTAPIAPGSWVTATTLPLGLNRVKAVPFGHQLVVSGDLPSGVGSDVQEIYDPATKKWTHAPLPAALDHAVTATDGSRIFLLGGRRTLSGGKKQVSAEVWQEAGPTGAWTSLPALPQPRYGGAAIWDGTRLLYAGGEDKALKVRSEVFALEGTTWKLVGKLSQARASMAVTTDGQGTAWFMGGRNAGQTLLYRNVDVVKGTGVSAGAPLPAALTLGAAAYIGDLGPCYIGGFKNPTGGHPAAAVKDLACREAERANPLPSMPSERFGTSAVILDDTLYILSGQTTSTSPPLRAVIALPLHAGSGASASG